MGIIAIGEPFVTKMGTVVKRYIENGRMYKSIDFSQSANRIAKEKGLVKKVVTYGEGNRPTNIADTFEKAEIKPIEQAETKAALSVTNPAKTKPVTNAGRKTDKNSVIYMSYDSFVGAVKRNLKKYKEILPKGLYEDIMERYGTQEKSIMQIIKDNSVDLSSIPTRDTFSPKKYNFQKFVSTIEKKEQELADFRLLDKSQKLSVVYTNAWTRSHLRQDLSSECRRGKTWSILKEVWQKSIYPDKTPYTTDKLIDTYLILMFRNGKKTFYGGNPLQKMETYAELDTQKIRTLKLMYAYIKEYKKNAHVLINPEYAKLKSTVDLNAMAKTIESMEAHYKNAFLKHFWTDERKIRFSEALKKEYNKFDERVELSNDIYEAIMRESFA